MLTVPGGPGGVTGGAKIESLHDSEASTSAHNAPRGRG